VFELLAQRTLVAAQLVAPAVGAPIGPAARATRAVIRLAILMVLVIREAPVYVACRT